ncbi:metallophosphoesterase [Breznakiella homolactica]|uniref:Metallophosphoesterase n=1 Tax=Breznakiella homolactica TaxID=2798577 RepID=A0A7T8BBN7_9SPIR|nr:metallophosphoesterase [Breznakiella homolactica]QQO10265.1 metallophosphoesterase [Breznakiella homolactica]
MTRILHSRGYPGKEILLPALRALKQVTANEDPEIRPRGRNGKPGGLILLRDLPVIIVPDLHARPHFLETLASWIPPGFTEPALALMEKDALQVLCVGDGFHSESPGYKRWLEAYQEYLKSYRTHKAMDGEMEDSLKLMLLVMDWKIHYPANFHFLKGNHENIANEHSKDNRSFRKFVFEGDMVTLWFKKFLGQEVFEWYYDFEKNLPIMAAGNGFCVSHGEPRRYYTREEVINCYSNREIIFDFTWTDNGESDEHVVEDYLRDYFPDMPDALYYGGHRPVSDLYQLRAGGRYVQIHNPLRYPVVYLRNPRDMKNNYGIVYIDGCG